jgi:hypothetical protein
MRIGIACVALALLAPAVARAGTYDVVSCNAPGAGGVNHSLSYGAAAWDPAENGAAQSWYEGDASCADGLVARSSTVDGTQAHWLSGAGWAFDAPAGTTIVGFSSWRFGEARDSGGDDPNTPFEDEGDHWQTAVVDHTGQPVDGGAGGETCQHGVGSDACTIGVAGGEQRDHRVATSRVRWQVACVGSITGGCFTSYGGYPLATMVVYGARVTLEDGSRPSLALGGPLLAAGRWHRPTEQLKYSATDNSGIRSATLTAGAIVARDRRICNFTYPVPCTNASGRPFTIPARLPDGRYPVTLTVTDAAGNARRASAAVAIDGTPPAADLRRPRGRVLRVGVADAASGFAAGRIDVRESAAEPWRALPTTYASGILRARLDRGRPARTQVRVSARDNAGNAVTGIAARFRITSVTSGRLRAHVRRGGRVRVKHGRRVTVRGPLVLAARQPLAGVPVSVSSTPIGAGAVPYAEPGAVTGPTGRFVIRLAKGPARTARIRSAAAGGALAAERALRLRVPASSTIRASRRHLTGAGHVRFRGRVRDAGANLVVVLQGRERGRWRTFADTRTRAGGRWHVGYDFSGRPGSYPIRVRIRRQADLRYVTGYSRRVTINVG